MRVSTEMKVHMIFLIDHDVTGLERLQDEFSAPEESDEDGNFRRKLYYVGSTMFSINCMP